MLVIIAQNDTFTGLDAEPYSRVWAIQLATENKVVTPAVLARFAEVARSDPSPIVRLYLASALQRVPLADHWEPLKGLVGHAKDAADPNLPLMVWYAPNRSARPTRRGP